MPILDTDILSIIRLEIEPYFSRIQRRVLQLPPTAVVSVTIVSFEEQVRGWLVYISKARTPQLTSAYRRLAELHADYSSRLVLPFDESATTEFQQLRDQKVRVGTMDLRIASIATSKGDIFVTRNLKDFLRIPNLVVEDWSV